MSKAKRYDFNFDGRDLKVEAEPEGEARYMVRMREPAGTAPAFVRIGYLTGARGHWLVEHGAGKSLLSSPAASAKEACFHLARWALTQPAFAQPGAKAKPAPARYAHIH